MFAARLAQGEHQVSLLARGHRLADLRQYGVMLEDYATGERSVTHLPLVEVLAPNSADDLVGVIMCKNRVAEILPALAANRRTPNVLFLHNSVPMLQKAARREQIDIALIGHARAARDESQHLAQEFLVLRDQSGLATPAIDRLLPYLAPATPLMPDGSKKIRLRWW